MGTASHSETRKDHRIHRFLHPFRNHKSPQNASQKTETARSQTSLPSSQPSKSSISKTKEQKPKSPESISFELWSDAYETLRDDQETKHLVEKYEQILTQQFNDSPGPIDQDSKNMFSTSDRQKRFEMMQNGLQNCLERAQKHPKVEGVAERAVQLIDFANDKVGDLLDSYPPASLAWSGFCIITPVLLNPILENKNMHEGLAHIIDRMDWSMALTDILLKENWKNKNDFQNLHRLLDRKLVDLYSDYLEYEMRSVCACFSPWLSGVKNLVKWDGWKANLDGLISKEKDIEQRSAQYNTEKIVASLKNAVGHLSTLSNDVSAMRQTQETERDDQRQIKRNQIIGRLNPVNSSPYRDRMLMNPERNQGTCEWFLQHENFNEWLDAEGSSRLLLLSAGPGCGKSVLSRFLAETELPRRSPANPVTYFFFKNSPDQRSICKAFSAILHQLLTQCPYIADSLGSDVDQAGKSLTDSFQTLGQLLKKACDYSQPTTIFCLLDALDECEPTDLAQLIQWIGSYLDGSMQKGDMRKTKSNAYIKFIVTTRGLPSILEQFAEYPTTYTQIAAEDSHTSRHIQQDIDAVMTDRFHQLVAAKKLDNETQKMIWNALERTSGGGQRTYMWVKLIFEALESNRRTAKKDWEALIKSPPKNVFEAYELLLNRVERSDYSRIRSMFHIIYCAERPFTVKEMNIAVHLHHVQNAYSVEEIDRMSDDDFRNWVTESCGFFVTEYNGQLFFIHETAREFLTASTTQSLVELHADFLSGLDYSQGRGGFQGSLTESIAHATMAEICIQYLNMDIFFGPEIHEDLQMARNEYMSHSTFLTSSMPKYILLEYFLENWKDHFLKSQVSKDEDDGLRILDIRDEFVPKYFELCDANGPLNSLLNEFGKPVWDPGSTDDEIFRATEITDELRFLIGAAIGHVRLFYQFWINEENMAYIDQLYHFGFPPKTTMLGWASKNGYLEMSRHLLHLGASTEIKSENGHTPLHDASYIGRTQVSRLLIDHGSDIEAKMEGGGDTPLFGAMLFGHAETVQLLIERNAKVDVRNIKGWTPLFFFFTRCGEEHDHIIYNVIRSNPSIINQPQDNHGMTLLHLAASTGRTQTMVFLLRRGANVYLRNEYGSTALHLACQWGSEESAKTILNWTSHYPSNQNVPPYDMVNHQNNEGNSPLHFASSKKIVQLLHLNGADLEKKNNDGDTPFEAMIRNHPRVWYGGSLSDKEKHEKWVDKANELLQAGANWKDAFQNLSEGSYDEFLELQAELNMKTRAGYEEWAENLDITILVSDEEEDSQEE
ncbi:ankyrin repeat domain protein, putative [Talaromyces stipitatus ATCC 10500]|uniref:Ankyrin repeat domain protein, putative n=1 Tax=Talaromyces stipitatus (strain ATCC 10500 / CBS 375.48 / QM 6759 / NRRL 1006) TaxID=441959 RepID=B8LTB7_TALSN|nr:ankyrin repeat domain protein, putative [Talaromyces stipitatus ATCC 10500]EED22491.1 ankyrin repeat domain protein, putative [Talaromyces stipitatus ATCC 10500]